MAFFEKDIILRNDKYVLMYSIHQYDIYAKSRITGKWFVKYKFTSLPVAYKFFKSLK